MQSDLLHKKCKPCEGGTKPLTSDEYGGFLRNEISGWDVKDEKKLEKRYRFKNFKEALAFVNKIGEIAERESHHPDISLGWGKVTISLWTHAIGGLSENDFIMAAKIDAL